MLPDLIFQEMLEIQTQLCTIFSFVNVDKLVFLSVKKKKKCGLKKHACSHKEEEDMISFMTNYIHKTQTQRCVEVQSFVLLKPEKPFSQVFPRQAPYTQVHRSIL